MTVLGTLVCFFTTVVHLLRLLVQVVPVELLVVGVLLLKLVHCHLRVVLVSEVIRLYVVLLRCKLLSLVLVLLLILEGLWGHLLFQFDLGFAGNLG
jgi:hypothetical protein